MGTAVLNSSKTLTKMLQITTLQKQPWTISDDKQRTFEEHYEKERAEDLEGRSYFPEEFQKDRGLLSEYRRWRQVVKFAPRARAHAEGRDV